jgi:hypothetical protein
LTPLKTALAFGALLLAGVNFNAGLEGIVQHVGYQCMRWCASVAN